MRAVGDAASGAATAPGAPVAASPPTYSRAFRATPAQVREARRFLARLLGNCPLARDALACLSELATNSVLHSNSRRPGGRFVVRATVRQVGLRVEVEDDGGAWEQWQERGDERGRGFAIVDALASDWSITGSEAGRIIWFELGSHARATVGQTDDQTIGKTDGRR
jgi:anti-sigma regulatory factor (Ser/Thr protein kinase)